MNAPNVIYNFISRKICFSCTPFIFSKILIILSELNCPFANYFIYFCLTQCEYRYKIMKKKHTILFIALMIASLGIITTWFAFTTQPDSFSNAPLTTIEIPRDSINLKTIRDDEQSQATFSLKPNSLGCFTKTQVLYNTTLKLHDLKLKGFVPAQRMSNVIKTIKGSKMAVPEQS